MNYLETWIEKVSAMRPLDRLAIAVVLLVVGYAVTSLPSWCDAECHKRKFIEEGLKCGLLMQVYAFKEATECFDSVTRRVNRYKQWGF
jgi:hypothetical protein